MSRPIIIPIQTLLRIKLLTVILVRLGIACSGKYTTERVVMVSFLHSARLVDHYTVVTLMVLQIVMILLGTGQVDVTLFGELQLLSTVFIDHITAIVSRCGCTTYLIDCSQFRAVSTISIGNRATITERYRTRQI